MNTKLKIALLLFFTVQLFFAQQKTVSGVVSDNSGPLPGVNILLKETSSGTETDFDGLYTIKANVGDTLIFSFVGMSTVYKTVTKEEDTYNVILNTNNNLLNEVIVTAQGIKRETKALGYSVTTINAKDIEYKPETDITKILTGKIAGVEVNNGGGFLGTSANIVIRSKNSISGNNQPLYVVDGAPIDGSRSFDLDPNNIARTTVLKGLAASTLYGSDGRNGVILITTKTGSTNTDTEKKFEITFSSTSSILQVGNLPDFQNTYGQGSDNNLRTTVFSSWGDRSLGQTVPHHLAISAYEDSFPEFQNATDTYDPVPNNVNDFFKTGFGSVHSLLLNKNLGNGNSVSFSLGHTDQEGYIAENTLKRYNLNFGSKVKLSNKFSFNSSVGYNKTVTRQPTKDFFTLLTWIPRTIDIHNLPFEDPTDGSNVYYRTSITNPKWQQKYTGSKNETDRLFAKLGLDFDITDKIKASYNFSLDNIRERRLDWENKGALENSTGFLRTVNEDTRTTNHRLNITTDSFNLDKKIKFRATAGAESKTKQNTFDGIYSQDQVVFGVINHNNFREHGLLQPLQSEFDDLSVNLNDVIDLFNPSESNVVGIYAQTEFDYSDFLYLTLSARNDWGSTTSRVNNTVFYPSASLAFIPTNVWDNLKGANNNYFKVRAGYGTSANFPEAYQTNPALVLTADAFINPFNNNVTSTNALNNFLANPDIKPELFKEFEIGIEGKLFNNFLGFDISAYKRIAKDQILESGLATSSGYTTTVINAGRIDTNGLEASINLNLFKPSNNNGFGWSMDTNFTAYETTVVDIPFDQINIQSDVNYAIEGEAYGVFRGTFNVRDDEGNLLINQDTGKVIDSSDLGLENKIIGDPNEDWRISNINTFTYKNFSLGVQLEYIHGGDIYSTTAENLLRRGVTKDTEENREGSFIIPGVYGDPNTGEVITDSEGNSITNNVQIGANDVYFQSLTDIDENIVYDASVIRLRDISLSYALPEKALENTPFGSVSFSVSGNNLWYKAPNLPKYLNLDPETLSSGTSNGKGLDFQNDPSYKQYSLSVKVTF